MFLVFVYRPEPTLTLSLSLSLTAGLREPPQSAGHPANHRHELQNTQRSLTSFSTLINPVRKNDLVFVIFDILVIMFILQIWPVVMQ